MEQPLNLQTKLAQSCIHQLRLFFIALQFFTRLSVPSWVGFSEEWLRTAIRYFPLVGLAVGLITAGSYALFFLIWNPVIAALLSTALGIFLTGALHEDGFADVCDGFGGGYTRERVLEIMKDSRIGTFGAIGIGMMLATKCSSLVLLPSQTAVTALIVGHPLSRLAASALVWRLDYVKTEGRAKSIAERMSHSEFGMALLTGIAPLLIVGVIECLSWAAIVVGLATVCIAALVMTLFFMRRIGGYTGDCLGAVQQVSEIAFYLGLLAMVRP